MPTLLRHCRLIVSVVAVFIALCGGRVSAEEIWVAPTHQQDVGGLGAASNVVWPVTAIGAVRLALAIPDDLQTFQSAKIVLLPNSPSGAANLVVYVCGAQPGSAATSNCSAATPHPFVGTASQLVEVDISAAVAARIGGPGTAYVAILAYSTPTTNTDRIVGMRFAYDAAVPAGAATLGANTFTGTQTAPAFVGDGSGVSNVNANTLDGLDATAFAATAHGHDVSQVANAARLEGGNILTGTQTINAGHLDLDDSTALAGLITKNGSPFIHNYGAQNTFFGANAGNLTMSGAGRNTAVGYEALGSNTTGIWNVAVGRFAMRNNSTGGANVAVGYNALDANTTGGANIAVGEDALDDNTTGNANTAVGAEALEDVSTASNNTAVGALALEHKTSGDNNTAVGYEAMGDSYTGASNTAVGTSALFITTGHDNVGVGYGAGQNATTGSNNIYVGANVTGVADEANTMHLGRVGTQTKTFMAGVRGIMTVNPDAITVMIDSAGQLGTTSSSRRGKEDISDMGNASARLLQLRPVTFRYAQPFAGGVKPTQYGLIAEEVAETFPELAVLNADGLAETVKYQDLSVLLLNEVQKQQHELQRQQRELTTERARVEALEGQVTDLLRRLSTLESTAK